MSRPHITICWIVGIILFVLSPQTAQAGLKICNESGSSRSVAIAYKDGGDWRSEGWWNIKDKDCKTVHSGDLKQRYYYYRAEHKGREVRRGDYTFCTTSKVFDIAGAENCKSRGYDQSSFGVIDTGKSAKNFTFTLTIAAPKAKDEAKAPKREASKPKAPKPKTLKRKAAVPMTPAPRFDNNPFSAGSLGEPFTVVGVFQGCENIDGWDHCAYHAEGVRHGAGYGDGTPDEILNALQNVPVGTRMLVRGDMKSFGDITAEVAIRQLEPVQQEPLDAVIEAMQGNWVSDQDGSWYFEIYGAERRNYSGGSLLANEYIRWASGCDRNSEDGKSTYIIITNPEDNEYSDCYYVVSVGRNHLTLSYVGGTGQDLEFTRQ